MGEKLPPDRAKWRCGQAGVINSLTAQNTENQHRRERRQKKLIGCFLDQAEMIEIPKRKIWKICYNLNVQISIFSSKFPIKAESSARDVMSITIKDVAFRAKVSIQTVSNVVNGRPVVVENTRQRVLKAIKELGYQPNASARSLRTRRTKTIALVVIASERGYLVSAPYLDHAISGIIDGARDEGYFILLYSVQPGQSAQALDDLYGQQRIDGAIVASAQLDEPFVDELACGPVPFVLLERPVSGVRAASVRAKSRQGGAQGVRYLTGRGYSQIAFVGGLPSWASAIERLEGYRQGMIEAGLQDQIRVVAGDWSLESGRRAALELLHGSEPPDAIFAANDVMAIGVLQAARELGLSTPGNVAVMGYDDFYTASLVSPALTTIRMPAYELGLKAAELMLSYDQDKMFAEQDILLDTQVIVRDSA